MTSAGEPAPRWPRAALGNIGFVCAALVGVFCLAHAFDPPRLNWGDPGSDYNVMTAGRNFQRYGFLEMRLTPVLLDAPLVHSNERHLIYTHYPQLPDLMNGVLRTVFRLSTLQQFRVVALLFSFGALFFVYLLMAAFWSRDIAQIGLALWVLNPVWIEHADYLHHAPYVAFFGFGAVHALHRSLTQAPAGQTGKWLWASGGFLFLAFFASYDAWLFIPPLLCLVALSDLGYRPQRLSRVLGFLAAFAIASVLCKIATNAWALGGVAAFWRDVRFQWLERGSNQLVQIGAGVWPTITGRVERFFSLLLFPVAAFWLVLPLIRRRWPDPIINDPSVRRNPLWLFVAALPFFLLFPQIWIEQYYPALLIVPFYAVGCAGVAVMLFRSTRRLAVVAAGTFVVMLMANSVSEVLTFPKATFDERSIETLGATLQRVSAPGQVINVDHVFDFFYRYYFSHLTTNLILVSPVRMNARIARIVETDRSTFGPARPTIFVQHKHVAEQLFGEGNYSLLAGYGLWQAWAYPERYRGFVDSLVTERDSALVAKVARVGDKVADTDAYAVWLIRRSPADSAITDASSARVGGPARRH